MSDMIIGCFQATTHLQGLLSTLYFHHHIHAQYACLCFVLSIVYMANRYFRIAAALLGLNPTPSYFIPYPFHDAILAGNTATGR